MPGLISDERQLDTKERDHLGCGKHERLWFSMSPTGFSTPESAAQVVERLVLQQRHRGRGSFAASVQKGYTVKVTVMLGGTFDWKVRKDGKVTDFGIAVLRTDGVVEITKEQDDQASI